MNTRSITAWIALATLVPSSVFAAQIFSEDTVAGLGTEIGIEGVSPNAALTVEVEPPVGPYIEMSSQTDAEGKAKVWVAGSDLEVAGDYGVTVTSDQGMEYSSFSVLPESVDPYQSSVQADVSSVEPGDEFTVEVILRDRFGNPLPGRSVELIPSRSRDSVSPYARETDERGQQRFSVRASESGEAAFRAFDLLSGKVVAGSISVSVGMHSGVGGPVQTAFAPSGSAEFFRRPQSPFRAQVGEEEGSFFGSAGEVQELSSFRMIIGDQETVAVPQFRVGLAESMNVEALNQHGQRFVEFEGTVWLWTTDKLAILPREGQINFIPGDNGLKRFSRALTLNTAGTHLLRITDNPESADVGILGELKVIVTGQEQSSTVGGMDITSPPPNTVLNTSDITVEGIGPPLINIVVRGGILVVEGETKANGRFAVPIQLDRAKKEHTLIVEDKEGNYTSLSRMVTLDMEGPEIIEAKFIPEAPEEGTDVMFVVRTEPNIDRAAVTVNGTEYPLAPVPGGPGTYQVLFKAPEGGTHDALVSLTDRPGNVTEETLPLTVAFRGLTVVQNVVAESQINAIALRWDPIPSSVEEVDAYRIYIGTEADEFLYTLETDRPTAAATVAGLRPGTTYFFAVTALSGQRESREKSETVDATVLGVQLSVTPEDGALHLTFDSLKQDIPLQSFLLEYAADPRYLGQPREPKRADDEREFRTLNGDLRAYTIRDLLNGVTYYIKLTPIASTSEVLEDLTSTGQGTPIGDGFTASAADPVKGNFHSGAPELPPRSPRPPRTTGSGIPTPVLLFAFASAASGVFLHLRHRRKQQRVLSFLEAMQSRYSR